MKERLELMVCPHLQSKTDEELVKELKAGRAEITNFALVFEQRPSGNKSEPIKCLGCTECLKLMKGLETGETKIEGWNKEYDS